MKTENKKLWPIGTEYFNKGLAHEIVDIYKTYNNRGELVKVRYVATHNFCGQRVFDYDVVDTTIARGVYTLRIAKKLEV